MVYLPPGTRYVSGMFALRVGSKALVYLKVWRKTRQHTLNHSILDRPPCPRPRARYPTPLSYSFLCAPARCQIEPRGASHRVLQLFPGGWTGGSRQVDASSGDGGDESRRKPTHPPTLPTLTHALTHPPTPRTHLPTHPPAHPKIEEQKKVPVTYIYIYICRYT